MKTLLLATVALSIAGSACAQEVTPQQRIDEAFAALHWGYTVLPVHVNKNPKIEAWILDPSLLSKEVAWPEAVSSSDDPMKAYAKEPLPGSGMFVIRFMGIRLAFGPRFVSRSAPRRHYASAPRHHRRVATREVAPRREAKSESDNSGTITVK